MALKALHVYKDLLSTTDHCRVQSSNLQKLSGLPIAGSEKGPYPASLCARTLQIYSVVCERMTIVERWVLGYEKLKVKFSLQTIM